VTLQEYVSEILLDVKTNGMSALKMYSERFDNYSGELSVTEEEWNVGESIPEDDKSVIRKIIKRLENYHLKQKPNDLMYTNEDGSLYGLVRVPIHRIGIYVPSGKPLPSSLLMVAIPARIAGVKDIVVTSSPNNGKLNPYVLYIAKELGITKFYKVGGIQAIAAMAYGVGMEKVDKIYGPGNKYVNEAKRQVYGEVGIDSLAGPSEICIIADESADQEYVLNDLLSQLEHGTESKGFLLTTSKRLYNYCQNSGAERYLFTDLLKCVEMSNEIAPEHLEIITEDPESLLPSIQNAGAIYLGPYTPVSAADYFLGVNHVLPTGKAARFSSVLTVDDFLKTMTVAKVSRNEFLSERNLGMRMAEIEGMPLHKNSLEARR